MKPLQGNRLSFLPGLYLAFGSFIFGLSARADQGSDGLGNTVAPTVYELRSSIQTGSEGVFLNQLVSSEVELPRLRLCDAPACGKPLVLKRAEIDDLAHAAGLDKRLTNWSGSEVVRIFRRMRPLAEKEVLQLLTSVLQQQYIKQQGELELRLSRPWTEISIPDESFTIRVQDLPTCGVIPAFLLRFEIETAHGEHLGSWQASLQAKVLREVWVARSTVKRGDAIRGSDLARERRDVLLCRESLAEFAADDPTLEFVEPIQPGVPLLARLVRSRPIVHRGQSVAATVQDGVLTISLKVEAMEDGAAGQIIRVRNPLSRRDLRGKVLDDQKVLVSL